jgi:hypothetical protein
MKNKGMIPRLAATMVFNHRLGMGRQWVYYGMGRGRGRSLSHNHSSVGLGRNR